MRQISNMNLEKFFELVFSNPNNINIHYSNINGSEKLIVNGKELTGESESYDDSKIKEKIYNYKTKIKTLDDDIFEKVIDEAEKRCFNICEMNKGLELENYTECEELYANNVIDMMTELIREVIKDKIQKLVDLLEQF